MNLKESKTPNPCRHCVPPERKPGCHSKCPKYTDWREEYEKEQDKIKKAKEEYYGR